MFAEKLFEDQIALVTGGRSGIGFAIAQMLQQHGATVIIASRKAGPLAEAALHLGCAHKACDIRKPEAIQELALFIKEYFGRLDILINNAGGQFPALAEYINDKGWNAVINNNLNGTFYITREMATQFFIPQKSGVIVNIIANIVRGMPGMAHTGAARAGVENLTKTLAQEWSAFNIRLNCIAPGIIESSGLETYPPPIQELFAEAKKSIPMGRFGTVEEVAQASCFLASPLASFINGITLQVDGAQHLNYDNMGLVDIVRGMMK